MTLKTIIDNFLLNLYEKRKARHEERLSILFQEAYNGVLNQESRIKAKDKYNHLLQHYYVTYNKRFNPLERAYRSRN